MKILSAALGSLVFAACFGAPVHANGYTCPNNGACNDKKHMTHGTIPKYPQPNDLVHVADEAKFSIRSDGAKFLLKPESGEWLPQFRDLPLTWVDKGKLMPYGECPAYGLAPFGVSDNLWDTYTHFKATSQILLHLNAALNGDQKHNFYLFPLAASKSRARFCILIPPHDSSELHDGAVHAD